MRIKIFTNDLPGGWSPIDLDKSLGGSEEVVTLLAKELAKEHQVIVYHTQKEKCTVEYHNAVFKDRSEASCTNEDVFITFKDPTPWINGAKAKVSIHWSSEVERPWETANIDYFVNLTDFHESRNVWVSSKKSRVIPHGIDLKSLDQHKVDREPNTLLYCSSPDRGLETLLKDWPIIKERFPNMRLKVAYGFEILKACSRNSPQALEYVNNMLMVMKQQGVEYLGQLSKEDLEKEYWRNEFWILPLEKPESELFCLNALKSRHCGMIPIVNKIGALRNTVGEHVPYADFLSGKLETTDKGKIGVRAQNWSGIVSDFWDNLFKG